MGISDQLGHQRSCVGGSHFLMGVVQTLAWKINLNMYIARPSIQHSRDNIVHIALKSSSDETLCKSSANTLPSFLPSALWMRHRHPPSPAPLPTKTCCEARLGGWIPHHGGGRAGAGAKRVLVLSAVRCCCNGIFGQQMACRCGGLFMSYSHPHRDSKETLCHPSW